MERGALSAKDGNTREWGTVSAVRLRRIGSSRVESSRVRRVALPSEQHRKATNNKCKSHVVESFSRRINRRHRRCQFRGNESSFRTGFVDELSGIQHRSKTDKPSGKGQVRLLRTTWDECQETLRGFLALFLSLTPTAYRPHMHQLRDTVQRPNMQIVWKIRYRT